jgi:hypothetical protein
MGPILNPAVPAGAFDELLVTAASVSRDQRKWEPGDGQIPVIVTQTPPSGGQLRWIRALRRIWCTIGPLFNRRTRISRTKPPAWDVCSRVKRRAPARCALALTNSYAVLQALHLPRRRWYIWPYESYIW